MQFTDRLARTEEAAALVRELTAGVPEQIGGAPDLAALFFTAPLRDGIAEVCAALRRELQPATLIGVSCESVIAGSVEVEQAPAAALLAGRLPGVTLRPFHVGAGEWRGLLQDDERLQQRIGAGERHRGQVVLGDPFTTPTDELLGALDRLFFAPTVGGMASAAHAPGRNVLVLNDALYTDGAVGVGLGGDFRLDAIVSQGCRPLGSPLVVTKAEQNAIMELGRRPALEVAQEFLHGLAPEELALLQNGLFVGVVIDEYRESFGRGDFLVRNVLGVDPASGAVVIGDAVRPGQTIQFHVRDAATAREDLAELLDPQQALGPAAGGLLFSCNGRGTRMFDQPHHDARLTQRLLQGVPLAGFFAMGELGPIGGKNFIHGHTASLALFRPAE